MRRIAVVLASAAVLTACGDDSPSGPSNEAPTAHLTISTTTPRATQAVSFSGSGSTDSDGDIEAWRWSFGDGQSATGPTVQHTYAVGGTYTVTLTVEDDDGAEDGVSQTITVIPSITGGWSGSFVSGGTTIAVQVSLIESLNGTVTGTGSFAAGGSSIPFVVSGSHPHPGATLVFDADCCTPATYVATVQSSTTMLGNITGSGFSGESLTLSR